MACTSLSSKIEVVAPSYIYPLITIFSMQKRGETQKGFLVAVILIAVAIVGVSYLSPGSTGKAVDGGVDVEVPSGEDLCPNPKSSATACVGNRYCHYSCEDMRHYKAIAEGECPTPRIGCRLGISYTIDAGSTCASAFAAIDHTKLKCIAPSICEDAGIVESEEKDAKCCKVTLEENCIPTSAFR